MHPTSRRSFLGHLTTLTIASAALMVPVWAETAAKTGDTRIARWKNDATAAFLLMFDDSWPSHFQVAAPALVERGMTATFYLNPGKGEYQKFAKEWEENLWRQGMVYGNHTMTHKGVKDADSAEYEIGECARVIRKMVPGKANRLISYGQPGVAADAWKITEQEMEQLLKKHHLISRPTFVGHGAVYHVKTTEEMLAFADRAIATKGMEYLVIHGVERIKPDWGYQDFWPLKQEILFGVLDGLKARRDRGDLWITDHISQHQYETERNRSQVQTTEVTARKISVKLTCDADPALYDQPLTLLTSVPANWKQAKVSQGDQATVVTVKDGLVRYDAQPQAGVITIEAADR